MFKYLWIIGIVALYLWWVFEAIKGFVETVVATKKYHKKFKFDYLPDVTTLYILIHVVAILCLSAIKFILYYF